MVWLKTNEAYLFTLGVIISVITTGKVGIFNYLRLIQEKRCGSLSRINQ